MREIKFRGKRVDNNEWVYGSLINNIFTNGKLNIPYIFDPNVYPEYDCWDDMAEMMDELEVIPKTVGQYTNRKDKNGKRIYKDDNLQYGNSPVYTVTWETDRWKMCGRKNGNGFCVDIPDFMEIIGNIHEPEAKQ